MNNCMTYLDFKMLITNNFKLLKNNKVLTHNPHGLVLNMFVQNKVVT